MPSDVGLAHALLNHEIDDKPMPVAQLDDYGTHVHEISRIHALSCPASITAMESMVNRFFSAS